MGKKLVLNQVTLCADGSIGIQWMKQVVDPDTGDVLFSEPHRTVVDFDGDVDAQIEAAADHLQSMGYRGSTAKFKAMVRKIDAIGKADSDITARRAEKIAAKAAIADAALAKN